VRHLLECLQNGAPCSARIAKAALVPSRNFSCIDSPIFRLRLMPGLASAG